MTKTSRGVPDGVARSDGGESAVAVGRPLRVAFAGTPAFAAVSLAALIASPHELVAVLTQPDRPSGRGRKLAASAVKTLALEHHLPVQQPATLRDAEALEALAATRPDVLVVVAYGLMLPREVLALPPLGCLNVHASLLPRWRGAAPVQRAILAGDAETGICIMQMDEGLDTGDVLLRVCTPIEPDENASELTARLAELGAGALVRALGGRRDGTLVPEPQPSEGVTYAAKLDKREARLDFARPAVELHRRIRALHGWPVAEAELDGARVRIWRSHLSEDSPRPGSSPHEVIPPGTIVAAGPAALTVAAGDTGIDLLELQSPGGRVGSGHAFAQGRDLVGRRFATLQDGSLASGPAALAVGARE